MNERLKKISTDRYTWINASRNVRVTPLRFFYPRNEADIQLIVREAEDKDFCVRAVGSGHSYSTVAKGRDYLLSMKFFSSAALTQKAGLKQAWQDVDLVTVGAGTILKKLNRYLDQEKLALANMGAVDFQTISGAILTGTHGTGITRPAMQDMVRSLKMVATGGQILQIEPSGGMTDAATFTSTNAIKLIQDDDTFYSVILGFGAMGIIYELTFKVEQQFWMTEKRYLKKWSKLRLELLDGSFMKLVRDTEFVAFRVNPYKVDDDHLCAVVEQEVISYDDRPKSFWARFRNPLSSIGGSLAFLIEKTIKKSLLKPKTVRKKINLAICSTKDKLFFDKSHKVLIQSGEAVIRYGISSEFAFPAKAEKIVEVLEAIFEQAEFNATEGSIYQSGHIPVRFVPPSKALLSSAYGRETVYVDIPLLFGTLGDIDILERYQERLIGLEGIPHWGKHNTRLYLHNDFIRSQFCRTTDWICVRKKLDPKGTFLNDFVLQMGLGNPTLAECPDT